METEGSLEEVGRCVCKCVSAGSYPVVCRTVSSVELRQALSDVIKLPQHSWRAVAMGIER